MPKRLIDLSPDLRKLRAEGYDIEIRSNYLLVKDVPYVNPQREVKRGTLISELTTAGETTSSPDDHSLYFRGETPCDANGTPLNKVIIGSERTPLTTDLVADHRFSSKPVPGGKYKDYHEKITAYTAILCSQAEVIAPGASAQTYPVITATEEESVFEYLDTASSRARISLVTEKLELAKIAIVGLGGTGAYVLDLVAKTPVKEIHLFDRDVLLTHNAFRAPGAPSVGELNAKPQKVAYLKSVYSKMRRAILDHAYHIDASNVAELQGMSFVFLCMDAGDAKRFIVENLEAWGIRFIDVGMDVEQRDDSLNGILRVTTSTPDKRDHFRNRVSLGDGAAGDEYDQNIQIADLNSLNAALAVIKWKKLCGFYQDFQNEHHSTYTIETNALTNDEQT
jgi:ThiF family